MITASQNASSVFQPKNTEKEPSILARVVAAVFMVNLRESLDAQSSSDKSDAAFHYGL